MNGGGRGREGGEDEEGEDEGEELGGEGGEAVEGEWGSGLGRRGRGSVKRGGVV